jgi:isopenicillin-N N-acyltransferase like protein
LYSHRKLKKIELNGSPRERGLQHGKALKFEIYEILDRTNYALSRFTKQDPKKIISDFTKENYFRSEVRKWTPELLKEIEGLADGADVDFNNIFAYQCIEEILFVLPYEKKKKPPVAHHCSSLGCYATPRNSAFIGQNLDWSNAFSGFNTLLYIKDEKKNLETYINTTPGELAENGMNNSPLGICVNSLFDDLNCSSEGLPVTLIIRGLLERSTVDEAVKFLTSIDHACAQNYMIGGIDKVVNYECSANMKSQYIPEGNPKRIFHTNHPEANTDFRLPPKILPNRNTFTRLDYLKYRMQPSKPFNIDHAKIALSSFFGPICVITKGDDLGTMTNFSSIFQLSEDPEMHLTLGPPSKFPYEIHRLRRKNQKYQEV